MAQIESRTPTVATPANVAKSFVQSMLLAGAMGAAAWGAIQTFSEHSTYLKVVQPAISEACSPAGPYQSDYRLKGVDTETASSLLIKHPEKTQRICAAVNNSLKAAHQEKDLFVDNTALRDLASALGMDRTTAQQVIAMKEASDAAKKIDAPTMMLATEVQELPSAPAPSMEPNL